MDPKEINHSSEPIRLFKSDFLEFFTHISPIAVIIIWLPVAIYFFYRSIVLLPSQGSWWVIPCGFLAGLWVWSLCEYLLHRFVFHFNAKTERQKKIFFLFHGIHHAQPHIKTRLVMPPIVSVPLAALFFGLFYVILVMVFHVPHWLPPIFSGFIVGYLTYDLIHYATHHFPMRKGVWKALKRYHMRHHYKRPDCLFGVSCPAWDYVFKTYAKE